MASKQDLMLNKQDQMLNLQEDTRDIQKLTYTKIQGMDSNLSDRLMKEISEARAEIKGLLNGVMPFGNISKK